MPLLNGDGNALLTTDKVANDMLARWKNNLVLCKSVYRDLEQQFGEIGDTINVKLPNNVIVNSGNVATTTTPLNDKTVALVVNQQKNVKFAWGMKDKNLSILQFGERYLEPAANRLANVADLAVASEMQKAYFQFGTVGNPLSYNDVTLGQAYAQEVAIPTDNMCRLITNTIDRANISNGISTLNQEAMVKEAIQKGYAGELAGFNTFFSQNVLTHTVGNDAGTEVVDGVVGNGNQLAVKTTQSGAFAVNDRFTIAGVQEINPITKKITGRLQVFTVLAGTSAGLTTTLTISPTINDGTGTTLDGEGNSITTAMDQNVITDGATDPAITVIGDANGVYRENYIMHRDAIAMAMVFLDLPVSGHGSRASDKQTGLNISVSEYFNGDQNQNNLRMDILYGTKLVRPDLIFRATNQKIG